MKCSQCGKIKADKDVFIIDETAVCMECFYGKGKPFEIYPIGFAKNDLKRGEGFRTTGKDKISRIELIESQKPFLHKLKEESSIMIVYYLHKTKNIRSVFERGLDGKKVGIFASRTPDRPSRIAVQDVKLLKVEGNTLFVEGLDAINGSPVLDIKMSWR